MKFKFLRILFLFAPLLATSALQAQETSPRYPAFKRYTTGQLEEIASPTRLRHRIFYVKPSEGPHAAWFDAVKQGDLAQVKKMVEAGQDIEVKDTASLGQTALLWAAFIGYTDIVQYLVGKGANLFATDRADVQHVFKSAVLGGNMDVIHYLYPLMKDKINLNAQDERDGETALMVAAGNNRLGAVQFLIEKGADVNSVSTHLDRDALEYACDTGNTALIETLLKAGAVSHKTGKPTCDTRKTSEH